LVDDVDAASKRLARPEREDEDDGKAGEAGTQVLQGVPQSMTTNRTAYGTLDAKRSRFSDRLGFFLALSEPAPSFRGESKTYDGKLTTFVGFPA
jgi:hypothetical protein